MIKTDVSVSNSVIDLLKTWKVEQAAQFLMMGVIASGHVITAEDGQSMHPDSPTRWLSKFAKRNNLPPIHPHKFRHSCATALLEAGVDPKTVQNRLGHADITMTMNIYAHCTQTMDRNAAQKIDNMIFPKAANDR